jgi:hypothetical protein
MPPDLFHHPAVRWLAAAAIAFALSVAALPAAPLVIL